MKLQAGHFFSINSSPTGDDNEVILFCFLPHTLFNSIILYITQDLLCSCPNQFMSTPYFSKAKFWNRSTNKSYNIAILIHPFIQHNKGPVNVCSQADKEFL